MGVLRFVSKLCFSLLNVGVWGLFFLLVSGAMVRDGLVTVDFNSHGEMVFEYYTILLLFISTIIISIKTIKEEWNADP